MQTCTSITDDPMKPFPVARELQTTQVRDQFHKGISNSHDELIIIQYKSNVKFIWLNLGFPTKFCAACKGMWDCFKFLI